MKLTVQPGKSPYFDVVDVDPKHAPGARVIRAAYCTKSEAELFASAPALKARVEQLERMWCVRAMAWLQRVFQKAVDGVPK